MVYEQEERAFREKLLDHYHHPRHVGMLREPDFSYAEYNHSCGDQVHMEGRIQGGVLMELSFIGSGCMLSQSIASMLSEVCRGKTVEQVLALDKEFIHNLIGISLGPTRLRCAMLPLYALQHGIKAYMSENSQEAE